MARKAGNRYTAIIEKVFLDRYRQDCKQIDFLRSDIKEAADFLGIAIPENIGDVIYSFRFRSDLPDSILRTQPAGLEWIIELAGRSRYRFVLRKQNRIQANENLAVIDIPDSTPELIRSYSLDDEQALLAILRYNRLIDTFLSLTTYSLQNHLRTTVPGIGQIEIDELYVGIDKLGCHYLIPVQAKGGNDQISVVQTMQDIRFVEERYPGLRSRAISAQFMDQNVIALFELNSQGDEIRIVEERHYRLIPATELDQSRIQDYNTRS